MEDKIVLVTGSSSGIGEATVLGFAKLGCKVVVHGTNLERVVEVAKECMNISPKNYEPLTYRVDLTNEDHLKILLKATIDHFGGLDILVNNAGIFAPTDINDENSYQVYLKLMKVNLDPIVLLTTLSIPYLKKSKGCIINVCSNLHSRCLPGSWAYSATKAALLAFTKGIAVDLAPHIRVNSVSPGPVATGIPVKMGATLEKFRSTISKDCPTGMVGEPEDVARAIIFLASPESAWITGSDFIIDGGSSIKPSASLINT